MATVKINGHDFAEAPLRISVLEEGICHYPPGLGRKHIGRFTQPAKIAVEISLDDEDSALTIKGEFRGGNSTNEISRAGIWIGVTDRPTFRKGGGQDNSQFFSVYSSDSQTGLDIRQWKFGNKPELRVVAAEDNPIRKDTFTAFIFASPLFEENARNEPVSLVLKFKPENEHGIIREREFQRTIEFEYSDENSSPLDIYQTHTSLGAFENQGDGYSVHPKQLHTAYAVLHAVEEIKNQRKDEPFPKDTLSIAYIGPDTTENLRTIFRALASEDVQYTICSTPDWDWAAAKHPHQGGRLSIEHLPNVTIVENPEDLNNKNIKGFDIVISTYIGYWALRDEQSETTYRAWLEKLLLSKGTKLITVDARDPSFCVLARPPQHIGWNHLEEFYNSLKMKRTDLFWNQKDNTNGDGQIACYIWTGGD